MCAECGAKPFAKTTATKATGFRIYSPLLHDKQEKGDLQLCQPTY